MNNYTELLPKMLFGEELKQVMVSLPEYHNEYRALDSGTRLLKLLDIFRIFIPQSMSDEIYHKVYAMTVMSFQQKGTREEIARLNEKVPGYADLGYHGIATGTTSSSIVGKSGIGKTTCIQKSLELLGPVIETGQPYRKIVPVVLVICPFDCNYKGLLKEILIAIDTALGTDNYERTKRGNYTSQDLLALVCHLCMLHVGILIIDEIQFIIRHKSGILLYQMIMQLINASRISVLLVGTNECLDFFQQEPQMARRVAGHRYGNLKYGTEFHKLVETIWNYQYVRTRTELTEGMVSWLFDHTGGNIGSLMDLVHDSQEIAIIKGSEKLDLVSLTEAYTRRMQMLHPFIEEEKIQVSGTTKARHSDELAVALADKPANDAPSVNEIAEAMKAEGLEPVSGFRRHYILEEVAV